MQNADLERNWAGGISDASPALQRVVMVFMSCFAEKARYLRAKEGDEGGTAWCWTLESGVLKENISLVPFSETVEVLLRLDNQIDRTHFRGVSIIWDKVDGKPLFACLFSDHKDATQMELSRLLVNQYTQERKERLERNFWLTIIAFMLALGFVAGMITWGLYRFGW